MSEMVTPQVTAVAVHQRAESACCAAPLDRVTPGAEEFTCQECGQPTDLVHGAPVYIPVTGSLTALPEGGA
jgi:hypothetical protein